MQNNHSILPTRKHEALSWNIRTWSLPAKLLESPAAAETGVIWFAGPWVTSLIHDSTIYGIMIYILLYDNTKYDETIYIYPLIMGISTIWVNYNYLAATETHR